MTTDATQPVPEVSSRAYSQANDHTQEKDSSNSAATRLYSEVSDLRTATLNSGARTNEASVGELDFSADLFNSKLAAKPGDSAVNTASGGTPEVSTKPSAYQQSGNHDVLPEPSPFKDLEKMIYNQYVHTNFDNSSKFLADGVTVADVSSRISELSPIQRREIFGAQSMYMTSDALAAQANHRQLKQLDDLGQYLGKLFGKFLGKQSEKQSPDDLLKDKAVVDERTKLLKLAEKLPEADRKQLEQYIHDFEARAKKGNLSPEEVAKTYKQIERLLEPSGDKPIAQTEKNKLALEVMRHAAHPQDIDQGGYNTCNVATVETRTYTRTPSEAAKLVADVALTGQYTAHDGTVVKVNPEAHGESTLALPTPDATRDHASEIFQVTAVNIHYEQENAKTKPPGHIRYVQLGENEMTPTERLHENGERLMDYSDPAHPKPVMDRNGKPVRVPNLDDNQICDVSEAITGKHEKGMLLSTSEGLPGHEGDDRIAICNSEEALRKRLKDAQTNHEFPIIVQVFADNDPFYTDGHFRRLPAGGGSHVVTITGYDAGPPERVDMDNQWGKPADHSMSVHDLFRSMNPPDQAIALLQKDVDYNREHHQIDYAKEFELLALKLNQHKITDSEYEAQATAKMDELKRHFENDHPSDAEKARDMLKVAEVIAQAPVDVQMRLIQKEYADGLINKDTFDQAIAVAGWQIDHDYNHYKENDKWFIPAWWQHHRQSSQLDEILSTLPKEEQEAIRKTIEEFNPKVPISLRRPKTPDTSNHKEDAIVLHNIRDNANTQLEAAQISFSAGDLLDHIFSKPHQDHSPTMSDGNIALMKVPDGWHMVPNDNNYLGPNVRSTGCRPKDNEEVELNVFYRGYNLSTASADSFHKLLTAAPHTLSADELAGVRDVLAEKANPNSFKITAAQTESINGKTVLSVTGNYRKFDYDTQILYVDANQNGATVQEVSYTAPANVYQKYLPEAQKSLQSILWKA